MRNFVSREDSAARERGDRKVFFPLRIRWGESDATLTHRVGEGLGARVSSEVSISFSTTGGQESGPENSWQGSLEPKTLGIRAHLYYYP